MAETNPQVVEERDVVVEREEASRPKLRYLEFVRVAAGSGTGGSLPGGALRAGQGPRGPAPVRRRAVDAVESAVKGVVGPVYGRFHGVPVDVLAFVDRKVDDTVQKLDRHLPQTLKAASGQAFAVARSVPSGARELTAEVQQSGVTGAARVVYGKVEPVAKNVYGRIQPVAKDLYVRYEPAAGHLAVST